MVGDSTELVLAVESVTMGDSTTGPVPAVDAVILEDSTELGVAVE